VRACVRTEAPQHQTSISDSDSDSDLHSRQMDRRHSNKTLSGNADSPTSRGSLQRFIGSWLALYRRMTAARLLQALLISHRCSLALPLDNLLFVPSGFPSFLQSSLRITSGTALLATRLGTYTLIMRIVRKMRFAQMLVCGACNKGKVLKCVARYTNGFKWPQHAIVCTWHRVGAEPAEPCA
jgi:hypothetical protein